MITLPRNTRDPVHVLGANGRIGQAVCRGLMAVGVKVIPVVRHEERYKATGLPMKPRMAEMLDHYSLSLALRDAVRVIACTPPRLTLPIIAATQSDVLLVLLGNARRYLHHADQEGLGAMEGERALLGSGRPGVMLHPTLIYGMPPPDPVRQMLRLLRSLPVLPLPGGGAAPIQPIALLDVVRCLISAVDRNWPTPAAFPIAGARPMPLVEFIRVVAEAGGVKMRPVLPIPVWMMPALSPFTVALPFLPQLSHDDLRNFAGDRSVDTRRMFTQLGINPVKLSDGLDAMLNVATAAGEPSLQRG